MAAKIKLGGESYPILFGYGAIRTIGDAWNVKGPQQVFEKFGQLFDGKEEGSFEQMEAMALLITAGISNAGEEAPALFAVVDIIMKDPSVMEVVMAEFTKSLPQGNPQPAPKGRKAKN